MNGRLIVKDMTMTVEAADPVEGTLQADDDVAVIDVSDLTGISLFVNQLVDNGNVVLTISKSIDGTNWTEITALDQSELGAGNNVATELTLSDANGMPLSTKMIKAVVSGKTGTGEYSIKAAGTQRAGYR